MSCQRTLNFDPWKTFSGNYKSTRVWLWLAYKFTKNYCPSRFFSKFIQTQKGLSYLSWQNTYPNLKTTCHIKLNFFLWTWLLETLLLSKYLISATAPLRKNILKRVKNSGTTGNSWYFNRFLYIDVKILDSYAQILW